MTVQEQRLDLMQRGFVIAENIIIQEPEGTIVQVVMNKVDSDGLLVTATPGFYFDGYSNDDFFCDTLRSCAKMVDNVFLERHAQNPNTCEHEEQKIAGGKIGCGKCMATLGQHNDIKVGWNVRLNNN